MDGQKNGNDGDRLLSPEAASAYLGSMGAGLAVTTLAKYRQQGEGPVFVKLGSKVRYRRSALDAFLNALPERTVTSDVPLGSRRPKKIAATA
jgi:hypothetical protein